MALKTLKNYIDGKWIAPENEKYLDVENPSSGEIIAQVPISGISDMNLAIQSAQKAFLNWSNTPVARRVEYLFELRNLVIKNEKIITGILVEEMGKSLSDAGAELKRTIQNIEVACGMPVLQQGINVIGASYDMDGEVIRLPLGVFGMIAPFNFPAMVPFWFIPYALATGNTFIMKPSELVPMTMQFLTQMIEQTGLPPGVFNLVNGDKTAAAAMLESPIVKGISFVGSTPVCSYIAGKCASSNKRFQAMGSAKNHLVIMPDARIDEAVRNMITSSYGCAGQRCMASSAIVCVGDDTYDLVCKSFIKAAKEVIVANPLDPAVADIDMVMGPVITSKAREKIISLIEDGVNEGATLALDGRNIKISGCENGYFIGPTVFTDVKPGMKIHRTEIFGPVVIIMKADNLDEAISIINEHQYGNGASIYTQNGYYARKFKLETQVGMIGINVGIPAPVAYLPFGGMKSSQFADIKAQGTAIVNFYTEGKIVTERYWKEE